MDALAAIQCGFLRTVSVPDGAPAEPLGGASGPKYAYLDEAIGRRREATIILAVDGDKAGANLFHDLVLRLGRARCKFVNYPFKRSKREQRCKDLNEVLQEWGEKGVVETAAWSSCSPSRPLCCP
jgi:twinkle protein